MSQIGASVAQIFHIWRSFFSGKLLIFPLNLRIKKTEFEPNYYNLAQNDLCLVGTVTLRPVPLKSLSFNTAYLWSTVNVGPSL